MGRTYRALPFDAFFENTMFHEVAHGLARCASARRGRTAAPTWRPSTSWRSARLTRGGATGARRIDLAKMQFALDALSAEILRMEGNGDPAVVKAFMDRYGIVDPQLRADLARITRTASRWTRCSSRGRRCWGCSI